jgi:hypothetical protein
MSFITIPYEYIFIKLSIALEICFWSNILYGHKKPKIKNMIKEKLQAIRNAIAENKKNAETKAWQDFYSHLQIRGNETHMRVRPISKETATSIFRAVDEILADERIDAVCNGMLDGIHNLYPYISHEFKTSSEYNDLCNKYYIHPIFAK